jgi:cytochrome c peroxidase
MQSEQDRGRFRTPQLRHIKETAPYLHTGQLATLADVIEFYDRGGEDTGYAGTRDPIIAPLNLTSAEKTDLVAFLETLTGDTVPDELRMDTSAP